MHFLQTVETGEEAKMEPTSEQPQTEQPSPLRVPTPEGSTAQVPSDQLSAQGKYIQSALVISNFKGLSEIHRDTRTSTYQISRIEKKNLTTKCPKIICNLTPLQKIYIY